MYDLMCGLSEQKIRCDMMCAVEGPSEDVVINDHATLIGCHAPVKLAATLISPAMICRLRKICYTYDIIHIHHPDPMACLALYLSGYKGRVVLHWHSDILKQRFLLQLYKPLQRWLIKRAERIVGTTPLYLEGSDYLKDVQSKTVCVPIGILPPVAQSERAAALRSSYGGKRIIFSLGRLVPYKGFEYLIEAARLLSDEFVVLIGGNGPLHTDLQDRIDRNGLQDRVKLLGFLSHDEVSAYYEACDLFCLSSVYKTEAFGIVQIEAMSFRKPVVATIIEGSGVHWVNADGESGRNVKCGDAAALAEAIKELALSPCDHERYAAGAKVRFEQMFTRDRMVKNMMAVYGRTE